MLVPWRVYHSHSYCSMLVKPPNVSCATGNISWPGAGFPMTIFNPWIPAITEVAKMTFLFKGVRSLGFPVHLTGCLTKIEWDFNRRSDRIRLQNSEWIRYILPRRSTKQIHPDTIGTKKSTNADFPFLCYLHSSEHIITCGNQFPLLNILLISGRIFWTTKT